MTDNLSLKQQLFHKCFEHVEARIDSIQTALDSVFQSKLEETKSSAGDKFETGRAMMQMEEEKLKTQLHRAKSELEVLAAITNRSARDQIGPGNLVSTSRDTYLIAIGLGKVDIEGVNYYCVSAESPVGTKLHGKTVGDSIEFNGRSSEIIGIE